MVRVTRIGKCSSQRARTTKFQPAAHTIVGEPHFGSRSLVPAREKCPCPASLPRSPWPAHPVSALSPGNYEAAAAHGDNFSRSRLRPPGQYCLQIVIRCPVDARCCALALHYRVVSLKRRILGRVIVNSEPNAAAASEARRQPLSPRAGSFGPSNFVWPPSPRGQLSRARSRQLMLCERVRFE